MKHCNPFPAAAFAIAALCVFTGCKAAADQKPEMNETAEQAAPSLVETQMVESDRNNIPQKWGYSFRESDKSDYQKAAQILNGALDLDFDVENVSGSRFGDWFVIKKAGEKNSEKLRDAPTPRGKAAVVNLKSQKVITKDNFSDALELYKMAENRAKSSEFSDFDREMFLGELASATSAIMFNHPDYLERSYVKVLTSPKFEFGEENTKFIYVITGNGMMKHAEQCTVTIYEDKLEFASKSVQY